MFYEIRMYDHLRLNELCSFPSQRTITKRNHSVLLTSLPAPRHHGHAGAGLDRRKEKLFTHCHSGTGNNGGRMQQAANWRAYLSDPCYNFAILVS